MSSAIEGTSVLGVLRAMFSLLRTLGSFVDQAVAGGYVLALAMVCLLQYVLHLMRAAQFRRQRAEFQNQMQGLEGELSSAQKDRALAQLENNILREFVTQTELEKSLDLILRRYILEPRDSFAAFLHREGNELRVHRSRGLSEESIVTLRVDESLLRRLSRDRVVLIERNSARFAAFMESLSPEDRPKFRELSLIAIGDDSGLIGGFLTATMYPAGATSEQQYELARRLMVSVAGNLKRSQTLAMQEHQLRSTSEMLELRGITDRQYEAPVQLVEAFIDCLKAKLSADRGVLFFDNETESGLKPMVQRGLPLPPHLMDVWQASEQLLMHEGRGKTHAQLLDASQLAARGVETLIGSALVAPVNNISGYSGVLCLTRQGRNPFTESQGQLAAWAAQHLSETISRVLAQAKVEQQARQDGLTELANRRTFDIQLTHELRDAARQDRECSLLLLDLDRFKQVNDTWGHLGGDAVLRHTADLLRDQVNRLRSSDRALVARYGGEELAILLPGIGSAGACRIAEMIRVALASSSVPFEGHRIAVTASIGVSTFPNNANMDVDLVAAADAALYQAKATGRNRVVLAGCQSTNKAST